MGSDRGPSMDPQRSRANLAPDEESRMQALHTIPESAEPSSGRNSPLYTILERLNEVEHTVNQSRKEYREVMRAIHKSSGSKSKKKSKKPPKARDPRDKHPFRVSFLVSTVFSIFRSKLTSLQHILRRHLYRLFNNAKEDHELFSRPTPTPEDIEAFNFRQPGCIRISATNFSIDWTGPIDSPFNTEAESVFAEDLLNRIVEHGWYQEKAPFPEDFRDAAYIQKALHIQLKHLCGKFSRFKENDVQSYQDKLAHNSRYQRKRLVRLLSHTSPYSFLMIPKALQ